MRIVSLVALVLATGCSEGRSRGDVGSSAGSAGKPGGGAAGSGGTAGTAGSRGDAGIDPQCEPGETRGPFAFGVTDPSGASVPVGYRTAGFTLRGIVRAVGRTYFTVEGCSVFDAGAPGGSGAGGEGGEGGSDSPGGAGGAGSGDCEPGLWIVEAVTAELVLPIETAMHVNVAFARWCQPFSGCNHTMVVRDELASGEPVLLAMYSAIFGGHTGAVRTPLEWPVTLELVELDCPSPDSPGNTGDLTTWALRMAGRANPDSSILLHVGEGDYLFLDPDSDERWVARNLAAYDVGGSDASTRLVFYLSNLY